MTIHLDAQIEAAIRRKVESGRYGDADEVIRAALQALDERERLQQLRAKLRVGLDQLERGEGCPFTSEVFEEIVQNAIKKDFAGLQPNPDVCP